MKQFDDTDARVVVVDNQSQDGSVAALHDWIVAHDGRDVIRLVEAEENGGFAAGNNIGIRAVNANYYLLLNSDTIVRSGAISILLHTAEEHPDAGIVSPRLEWPDGTPQESCFRYLSPMSEFIDAAQTGPIRTALNRFNVPLPVSNEIVHPQWTSFACALVRRDLINDIGFMDEKFFMYFEDVEFCRRVRNAGWAIINNPNARVVHLRGGSSPVKRKALERKRLPHYYYASRTRYFYLAYGWLGLTLANILWSLGRCVAKCREKLEHRKPMVPERQWADIWINWLNPSASCLSSNRNRI